ncbi:MAG: VPLPA-CTERM sorting domain-containing protein [Pseudomonadota bacterium]
MAAVGFGQDASATFVSYSFSANVTQEVRGNMLASSEESFFALGTLISGSFTYDNEAAVVASGPDGTIYASLSNLTGSIDGMNFSDTNGSSLVSNNGFDLDPFDPNNPLIDLLALAADGGPDTSLQGFSVVSQSTQFDLVNVRMFWLSPSGDFLDDESLPLMPAAEDAQIARLALDFVSANDPTLNHTVFAEPLAVTPIPLPAAVWMMLSGVGALRIVGRASTKQGRIAASRR